MKTSLKTLALLLGVLPLPHLVHAETPPQTATVPVTPERADIAAVKTGKDGPRFLQMHESFLARGKAGPVGLLFLGDSITEGWFRGREIWNARYAPLNAANFGISGDKTEHVLWRIQNSELDGINPKVVVLMIGINNWYYPVKDIVAADTKIVQEIHQKLPDTRVLLLGILPFGDAPTTPELKSRRDNIQAVDLELAKLDDGQKTRYLYFGDKFLDADGAIPHDIMADKLHPTTKGYGIWADAMQPLLDEMMK